MHAPDGAPVQATYGFLRTILKVLREREPEVVVTAFERGPSFRNELYADYKANRAEPPDDLVPQFESSRRAAAALGVHPLEVDGFEADDLIGTLVAPLRERGCHVLVVTSDKDMAQLVADGITLFDAARDRELDAAGVHDVYGVVPEQIVDYLALVGDQVDNIPGVPGIGPKTAQILLREAGSIEALLADPGRVAAMPIRGAKAVGDRLLAAREQIRVARALATIRRDVPVDIDLAGLEYRGADRQAVEREFAALGFGGRIRGEIKRWANDPVSGRLHL